MSVARFIADQRTKYQVPHAITCVLLGVSVSWFYKWVGRRPTKTAQRRAKVDAAVAKEFAQKNPPLDLLRDHTQEDPRVTFADGIAEEEKKTVRRTLEEYCALDTLAMVEIVEKLREMV